MSTLRPGEITFCVMARTETNEPGRRIHSSIGLARPTDPAMYGYISEHHGFGMTSEESGDYAEDLAATMLASTLGIEFDPNAAWDERKRTYQTSNLIISSSSMTAAAHGDAAGRWTLRSGRCGFSLYRASIMANVPTFALPPSFLANRAAQHRCFVLYSGYSVRHRDHPPQWLAFRAARHPASERNAG